MKYHFHLQQVLQLNLLYLLMEHTNYILKTQMVMQFKQVLYLQFLMHQPGFVAGSLGSFAAGSTISTITITATNATSFAVQSGSLPTGLSLNTGSGSATITGTVSSGITSDTLFSFTVRATDAEGQTADRAFQ